MRLKLLFTLGFVLFLSTLASSNECARFGHVCPGKVTAKPATPTPPSKAATRATGTNAATRTNPITPAKAQAQIRATADSNESSTLIINKLLYI